MLAATAANSSSLNQSATSNTSPTPSLDSLNGIAVSMGPLIGPPPGSSMSQMNGDQHSDNGSHSESSSGVGSMAVNTGAAAAGNQGTNGLQNPNGVMNVGQHGQVDRSSSTSSTTSLCSSGLGSSPLGNAALPLFGGGISSSNSHATVVNGSGNIGSLENGLGQAGAGSPNISHQQLSPQQLGSVTPMCSLCCASFNRPKVLHECFHSFCQGCLEKLQRHCDGIECPTCQKETPLDHNGISGLMSDVGIVGLENQPRGGPEFQHTMGNLCTIVGCRDSAIARCNSCTNFLCLSCLQSHQYQNHHVTTLGEFNSKKACHTDIKEFQNITSLMTESKNRVQDIRSKMKNYDATLVTMGEQFTKSRSDINEAFRYFSALIEERKQELIRELESQYSVNRVAMNTYQHQAQETVQGIYQLTEFVERLFRNVNNHEASKFKSLLEKKMGGLLDSYDAAFVNFDDLTDFGFVPNCGNAQVFIRKSLGVIKKSSNFSDPSPSTARNNEASAAVGGPVSKQPPISRPAKLSNGMEGIVLSSYMGNGNCTNVENGLVQSLASLAVGSNASSAATGGLVVNGELGHQAATSSASIPPTTLANGMNGFHHDNEMSSQYSASGAKAMMPDKRLGPHVQSQAGGMYFADYSTSLSKRMTGTTLNAIMTDYEKWSTGATNNDMASKMHLYNNGENNVSAAVATYRSNGANNGVYPQGAVANSNNIMGELSINLGLQPSQQPSSGASSLSGLSVSNGIYPKSQIKRQKMIYHCKFGEFGVLEGQFTEPSGVAVNAQNDIIVADTNNHRIQIFDKDGRFKFQFGECGKRDGQLLYPNRVAAVKSSGDIIVTERSPTHQVQIYNQYGQFVRKFGANILQHPRGVCVDNKGRIIVVECKVMRVIIFDQMGNVLNKFGCSKHLEFPNGVVVNDRQEIFISDNRAHCVKVFSYEGQYLRQIGGEGLTNYPIGVGINAAGDVTIADNHNNFNLSVFSQDGHMRSALESKVKHAQCFDVALMDDGSVVLASKDYRLYIYRYIQLAPIGMC